MTAIVKSISLAALLLLTGCGPRFDWEGNWRGDRNLPTPPGGDPSVGKTLGRVDLEIESGGKFVLVEAGIPKTGRIETSGMQGTLKVDHIAGRAVARMGDGVKNANLPVRLTANSDGTIQFVDPGGFFKEAVTLHRRSKP